MNYLWGGMLLTGIVYGVLTGNVKDITDAVLASSRERSRYVLPCLELWHSGQDLWKWQWMRES